MKAIKILMLQDSTSIKNYYAAEGLFREE